jgi:hypothetical protein
MVRLKLDIRSADADSEAVYLAVEVRRTLEAGTR